jgi:shikimate dehydrogenase
MTGEMFLIGRHIGHSLSPAMWNHLFERTGRMIRYGLRDVEAGGLADVLTELRSGDVVAANVTMPHKAWAASVSDHLSDAAAATGAVNLLRPDGPIIRGSNTDVPGARSVLERRAPYDNVLLLGAGGTAVALLESLVGLSTHVVIANRTRAHAVTLASRYGRRFGGVEVVAWEQRDERAPAADLIVSTVPIVDVSPIDITVAKSHAHLYDVMYRDRPTALQQAAAARGVPLADGLAHLAAQAIAMLGPLGIEHESATHLTDGLERATGRPVEAWGEPIV